MTQMPLRDSQPSFKGICGVARVDITPPVGIYARNWGAAAHDVAEGIHRPLYATALTIQGDESEQPLVLIAFDLGWWKSLEDEWFIRGGVIETYNLPPERVMMNLSHTHACPSMCRDDADLPGGHLIADYLQLVRDRMIEVTGAALANRQPAILDWAWGKCDLARNRDLPDPDKPRSVCGFNPDGFSDDTLLVGRVTTADGKALATIANYACHPTTLAWQNKLISPDFVGSFNETLEANTGGAPSLFLQGNSGELQPRECYTGDLSIPEAHGRKLGYAVLAVLEGMLPPATQLEYSGVVESGAPLATWKRVPEPSNSTVKAQIINVELELRDLPSYEELTEQMEKCEDRAIHERLRRKRRVRRYVGDGSTSQMPLYIWQIGAAVLVAQANEAYSDLQIELRRRYPDIPLAMMNLTNGSCAYLTPAPLYDIDIYQAWQSPYERGSLERTIEATADAVEGILAS